MIPITIGTPRAFEAWLRSAPPGTRFSYYVGHLANDRATPHPGRGAIDEIAAAAYAAYEDGLVELVQERIGFGCYSYYAIRTSEGIL